jgi:hypothetical protein
MEICPIEKKKKGGTALDGKATRLQNVSMVKDVSILSNAYCKHTKIRPHPTKHTKSDTS